MPEYDAVDDPKPFVSLPTPDRLAHLRQELAEYWGEMGKLTAIDSAEVLQKLSSWAARAGEMRFLIIANEDRRTAAFRTKQLDPFLEAIELQFRIHSRLIAVRGQEIDLNRGQF